MSCDGVFAANAASADAFAAAAAFAERSRVRFSSSLMTASWRFCSSSASRRSEEGTHIDAKTVYRQDGRTCFALNEVVIDLQQIHLDGVWQRDSLLLALLTTRCWSRSRCGGSLTLRRLFDSDEDSSSSDASPFSFRTSLPSARSWFMNGSMARATASST